MAVEGWTEGFPSYVGRLHVRFWYVRRVWHGADDHVIFGVATLADDRAPSNPVKGFAKAVTIRSGSLTFGPSSPVGLSSTRKWEPKAAPPDEMASVMLAACHHHRVRKDTLRRPSHVGVCCHAHPLTARCHSTIRRVFIFLLPAREALAQRDHEVVEVREQHRDDEQAQER